MVPHYLSVLGTGVSRTSQSRICSGKENITCTWGSTIDIDLYFPTKHYESRVKVKSLNESQVNCSFRGWHKSTIHFEEDWISIPQRTLQEGIHSNTYIRTRPILKLKHTILTSLVPVSSKSPTTNNFLSLWIDLLPQVLFFLCLTIFSLLYLITLPSLSLVWCQPFLFGLTISETRISRPLRMWVHLLINFKREFVFLSPFIFV